MNKKVFVFSIILSISVFSQNYPPPENVWMYTMCSKIYFGWSMPDSAEISGFRVYHKSDDDTLWSYLMDIDSPTTENIIPDLQQGILERIYNYSIWQNMCLGVSALYPDGKSPITETCMMGVADVWREPPYLRFIESEIDTVILDWYSGSAGCGDTASHYEVFRNFEDSSWIQIASIPLQQTQYHDLITKSGKYCYYVTLVTYHRELKSFENLCITVTSVNDDPGMKKGEIYTFQSMNYPNPFNPSTVISWQLAVGSQVDLSIFNLLGQKVSTLVSERQNAGYHQIEWNAGDMPSGVYYYIINAGEFKQVRKMVLLK